MHRVSTGGASSAGVPSAALPGLTYAPVVHHAPEAALAAARCLRELRPAALAVELAPALADHVLRAILRLPEWSIVVHADDEGQSYAHVIHPAEPLVEAVRTALDLGLPWHAVDANVPLAEAYDDGLPDPYAIRHLGLARYHALWVASGRLPAASPVDLLREHVMAHRLRGLVEAAGPVLAVVGLVHVAGIERALAEGAPLPLHRDRVKHATLFHLHPDSLAEVVPHAPLLDALVEARRSPPPPLAEPVAPTALSAAAAVERGRLRVLSGERAESEAQALRRAYLTVAAEARVVDDAWEGPDRWQVLVTLLREASLLYERTTGQQVAPWQRRGLDHFLAKYTRAEGRLLPDLYQLVAATRGAVDDNFAFEVMRLATHYPWQAETSDLPTTHLSADQLNLGSRVLRLRRHVPRTLRRLQRFPVRRRPQTDDPAAWRGDLEDAHIVSYPPEDIEIERFASGLKSRGPGFLEGDLWRSEPFTASLLDGLDVRETLRRVADGRLWVRETRTTPGDADAIVIVFDRDDAHHRYPFRMTWLGEHQNESDMAFYSTPPLDHVVGPGIFRAEYGGLMMLTPPMQLYDVWRIAEYAQLTDSPGEILTLAALDYSKRRNVVHVAAQPPSARMQAVARRLGRRLLHVPLGRLDPERLQKLRVVHILDGRARRKEVKKYVW